MHSLLTQHQETEIGHVLTGVALADFVTREATPMVLLAGAALGFMLRRTGYVPLPDRASRILFLGSPAYLVARWFGYDKAVAAGAFLALALVGVATGDRLRVADRSGHGARVIVKGKDSAKVTRAAKQVAGQGFPGPHNWPDPRGLLYNYG